MKLAITEFFNWIVDNGYFGKILLVNLTHDEINTEFPEELKETIENGLPEDAEFQNISEEPIAFGLVALILNFTIEDGEGGTESTEEFISGLDDVASIEITGIGRLM